MIREQEITISNARMIAPVLTQANQSKWLEAAATLSKRALEKEIAKEFPETQVQESARYVSEKRLELKVGISEELYEMLKRAQELVPSQTGKAASIEDALRAALEHYIEKTDPQKKAERALARAQNSGAFKQSAQVESHESQPNSQESPKSSKDKKSEPVPGQVINNQVDKTPMASHRQLQRDERKNVRYIPAKLQHAVRLRDQGQCVFKAASGQRCTERRWLEIHHIQPLADGGIHELQNLALVCRGHHQFLHH